MKRRLSRVFGKTKNIHKVVLSTKFVVGLGVLVLAGTYGAWQYHQATDLDKVFWGAVESNLQTTASSRHSFQKNAGQSIDQVTQISTEPSKLANSHTIYEQTGIDSATAVTENIGTEYKDYVRYTSITTSQKGATGEPLDFSSVVGVWGVGAVQDESETTGQLYNQSVLGVLPVGSLNLEDRKKLLNFMKEKGVYDYRLTATNRSWLVGRPTYEITVLVKPVAYLEVLKEFARYEGLNHLENIDPQEYKNAPLMSFVVHVDGWTHQVTKASQSTGAGLEDISGKNLKKNLQKAPVDAISTEELQAKLQSVR